MEDKYIYGKNTNDIPSLNTLKTLEKRKNYILKKLQEKIEEKSYFDYLTEELRALEKIMNFIKWMYNNLSNEKIKYIVEEYKNERNKKVIEEIVEENKEVEIIDEKIYSIFGDKISNNNKLEIILSKNNGINYISIESQKRKKEKIVWNKSWKLKLTLNRLEKILRMAKEKEGDKSKNNST
jgi:hypothetical protein